jgi:hypothetical protein
MRRRRWLASTRRLCRAASAFSAVAFLLLAATTLLAHPGAAAPVGGDAQVVTPQNGAADGGQPLAKGSATTAFSLELPTGAACTGDSTNGGYRVQSFMVPEGIDPAGLTFGPLGPLPKGLGADFRQPLYAVSSTPFSNAPTNLADEPGGPGTIINVPSFDLSVFSADDLEVGAYSIGIACTKGPPSPTQLDKYWTTRLDLSPASRPGEAPSWTTPASAPRPTPATSASESTTAGAAPAAGTGTEGAKQDPAKPASTQAKDEETDSPRDSAGPGPSGGQPSFNLPAAEIASTLTAAGDATRSLMVWLALALVFARIAFLLARTPAVVPSALR